MLKFLYNLKYFNYFYVLIYDVINCFGYLYIEKCNNIIM